MNNVKITEWQHQIARYGNEQAFAELFRHFYDRLLRFCLQYVQAREAAEEIVADVFVKVWNRREALEYYEDPLLGPRLIEISGALMQLPESNARQVMGSPDDLKLKSCMTLFASLPGVDPVFRQVLDKYFEGKQDERTLERLTDDG